MNVDLRHQMRFFSQACDKVVASLAKKDLPDAGRRRLILTLQSVFRWRRKWLGMVESEGAIPSAELAVLRHEFAQAGLAVCEEQQIALSARLESPRLSVRERCALINMYCTVLKMIWHLERDYDRTTRGDQVPPTSAAAS